jgi:competence protein ComEC
MRPASDRVTIFTFHDGPRLLLCEPEQKLAYERNFTGMQLRNYMNTTSHKCIYSLGLWMALIAAAVAGQKDQTLDIYFVDVEGGGGTLIVTPAGEAIEVDCGVPGDRDPGRIHKVLADMAGLDHIDHLVVTHFDGDHYGGAPNLAKLQPILNLWDNGVPDKDPSGRANAEAYATQMKPYREMNAGTRHIIAPGDVLPLKQSGNAATARVTIRCLAAHEKFIKAPVDGSTGTNAICGVIPDKAREIDDNGNSVVLLVSFGPFRFLDPADLLWDWEKQLVCPVNLVGAVDVFQVSQHGLDRSNHPFLVRSLAPTVSVMVNGSTKGAEPETIATLRATPSIQANYQLHKNLRSDSQNNTSDEYIANLEKQCNANFIKLSVMPDGKSYVVSIPAKNHQKTFQTKTAQK